MKDFDNLSFSEKRKIIHQKLDELSDLMISYDTNNVGLPWPEHVRLASLLRNMKDQF